MLHLKCLILHKSFFVAPLPSIACVLQHLPILETLVCGLALVRPFDDDDDDVDDMTKLDGYGESNQSPNATAYNCLVSHLKTVKIYVIPMEVSETKRMLNLVQFLLNRARVLQSMTVVLKKSGRKDISFKISQSLCRFLRCSENAVVELISQCS